MFGIRIGLVLAAGLFAAGCGDDSGGNGGGGELDVGEVIARDAAGVALRLGETVTVEAIATVDAELFANNKLKQFIQDDGDGVMVFHATSAEVDAYVEGDRLRVTGVVGQADPTSDNNRAEGTVLVDVTDGSIELVSSGNPVPQPLSATLGQITAGGGDWVGTLVRVADVRKVAGNWPTSSRSAEVTISDDGGASTVVLRLQRNAIDTALIDELAAIGDGAFDLVGIAVQDDTNDDGDLFDGHEIWLRGAQDVSAG
jgi:hypothetical protein